MQPDFSTFTMTRRNMPHWGCASAVYWVTFRLADSIPQAQLRTWQEERRLWLLQHPEPWDDTAWREYEARFGRRFEGWLDAGLGSCALARESVREAVQSCFLRFEGKRLVLHHAVIMPNHVHALLEPLGGESLGRILQGIKGASARAANQLLGRTGAFWMDESYDHIVRSGAQYDHFVHYIRENPVRARLGVGTFWLYEGRVAA